VNLSLYSDLVFADGCVMATLAEIEKLAFDLPDSERALLAAHLLQSLPSAFHEGDDAVAEAVCRDAELDANPEAANTIEPMDAQIRGRQRWSGLDTALRGKTALFTAECAANNLRLRRISGIISA
jgi:hypothetical protein